MNLSRIYKRKRRFILFFLQNLSDVAGFFYTEKVEAEA